MLRFRGKDVLRISKYNMLMFIILGLLGLGISVGYLCRHVPAFKGLEHSISYTIFAMLFIFGITIGANQSLLNNIGEFGIQAAILAICGVLGSLVASFIAYKLLSRKEVSMKNNLIVILCFTAGIFCGTFANTTISTYCEKLPQFLLYALVIQVGLNLGANAELGKMIKDIRFSSLLLPFFTIIGTLVFSAAASLLLTSWNIYDCMAVGSGFAYYSLSSLLIVQLKEASAGIEIASQLGAIALLANIIREMLALFGAPLYASFFGKFAPVSVAGINSMDVCLPVISRYSGKNIVPVAIIHGIILEISVPLLISLFCK